MLLFSCFLLSFYFSKAATLDALTTQENGLQGASAPGLAVDLGCGSGRDAVHISRVLERAANLYTLDQFSSLRFNLLRKPPPTSNNDNTTNAQIPGGDKRVRFKRYQRVHVLVRVRDIPLGRPRPRERVVVWTARV